MSPKRARPQSLCFSETIYHEKWFRKWFFPALGEWKLKNTTWSFIRYSCSFWAFSSLLFKKAVSSKIGSSVAALKLKSPNQKVKLKHKKWKSTSPFPVNSGHISCRNLQLNASVNIAEKVKTVPVIYQISQETKQNNWYCRCIIKS